MFGKRESWIPTTVFSEITEETRSFSSTAATLGGGAPLTFGVAGVPLRGVGSKNSSSSAVFLFPLLLLGLLLMLCLWRMYWNNNKLVPNVVPYKEVDWAR